MKPDLLTELSDIKETLKKLDKNKDLLEDYEDNNNLQEVILKVRAVTAYAKSLRTKCEFKFFEQKYGKNFTRNDLLNNGDLE